MLNLNKNTRLFFFQYIFQRDYTTDFELDDFVKKNLRKRPCNKKKLRSMYQSFVVNEITIKELINDEILKKTNKISIFLVYAFYSEYLIDKSKKKMLMSEYIKLSKDFLTIDEVKFFNFLLDSIAKKAP
jgi:transcription termination factor NusB|tara:strand:- start:736 stop:1122 length:387 start_codon:yes stop_codon:yes gene_type:complete